MKRILIAAVSLTALATSALAADLPSRKAPVVAPVVVAPMWTGFYAGLNAGYNWGTNSNQRSITYVYSNNEPVPADGAAMSGVATVTQSGFIGGAQFGYNYQYGSNIVLGLETDISGTGIRGNQGTRGYSTGYSQDNQKSYNAFGTATVSGGVDYLGTVRGRVGYLWTPALLTYGTAGFAYGGVYANVAQGYNATDNYVYSGGGHQNQLLSGWTAGGGAEWMFAPNWSIKAEALYWNLGNMNVQTAVWGSSANTYGTGTTQVNYQGVKAVAGINYHFNFGSAPVVAKF